MRHLLEYLMARALFGVLGRLPTGPGERLGAALGRVAHRLGWRRAVVEDQLARAFPDRGRDWVRSTGRACYEHLGREAVAVTWLARAGGTAIRRAVERFEGRERLAEALAESGSAVIVTGHLGNWEVAGSTLPAFGFPMDAVMQGIKNPWLDTYVRRVRRRLGMGLVDRVDAWDRLVETLRDGRIVAFVADQDARERGVFVPFFGRLASTHRAPALLALRADVPLFVGGVRRVGARRYHAWAIPLDPPTGDSVRAQVRELTRRWVEVLEERIRLSPDQYFWHHRRWKTRPPGTAAADAGTRET